MNMKPLNTDLFFKEKGIKHRISCEINNLFLQCGNNDSVSIEPIDNKYMVKVILNNNTYKFVLPVSYPFKQPEEIFYNNNNYNKILSTNTDKIRYYLIKIYGKTCLCCSSLTCGVNWMPSIPLSALINEINTNVKLKKDLLLYILCDYIKIKYKCHFAYIESYLL